MGIKVAFLDVGQGDSTVIVLPDCRSALVVDCFKASETIGYLEQNEIDTLSYVFLTHSERDHIARIVELLQNFEQFGQITGIGYHFDTPRIAKGQRKFIFRQLLQLIQRFGWEASTPSMGESWTFQGVLLEVLHPTKLNLEESILSDDPNNPSLMLRVTSNGRRVLLTADIMGKGWRWILERETDLQADVLKFPHHGAWYEPKDREPSLAEILKRVNPTFVVISVGTYKKKNWIHPAPNTFSLLRSKPNLRFVCTEATSQCHPPLESITPKIPCPCAGTVEVLIDKNRIEVIPDHATHSEVISQFETPQCRITEGETSTNH